MVGHGQAHPVPDCGALQALLAPDIGYRGFPDYKYFPFFLSHEIILASGVYIVAGKGFRPSPLYLIGIELMGLAGFLLLWLPFALARLFSSK